jgi:serine/threonine-protein kinase RsbW
LHHRFVEVIIFLMPSDGSIPLCEFESDQLILRLEKTVDGHVEAIEPVVDEIMKLVIENGCAGDSEFEISLALREALANAIVYGCDNDPGEKVQLCVSCDDARGILIVVRDPGDGFDPATLPSPVVGQNIFSKGGRGIFLINQLMDEVRFDRGGTEIRMVKRQ